MQTNGIHLLDHQDAKPSKAQREVAMLQQMAHVTAEAAASRVVEHYMAQMPGLVAHMIGEILHANGMELKAPEAWSNIPAVAPTTESQSGDAAAPERPDCRECGCGLYHEADCSLALSEPIVYEDDQGLPCTGIPEPHGDRE